MMNENMEDIENNEWNENPNSIHNEQNRTNNSNNIVDDDDTETQENDHDDDEYDENVGEVVNESNIPISTRSGNSCSKQQQQQQQQQHSNKHHKEEEEKLGVNDNHEEDPETIITQPSTSSMIHSTSSVKLEKKGVTSITSITSTTNHDEDDEDDDENDIYNENKSFCKAPSKQQQLQQREIIQEPKIHATITTNTTSSSYRDNDETQNYDNDFEHVHVNHHDMSLLNIGLEFGGNGGGDNDDNNNHINQKNLNNNYNKDEYDEYDNDENDNDSFSNEIGMGSIHSSDVNSSITNVSTSASTSTFESSPFKSPLQQQHQHQQHLRHFNNTPSTINRLDHFVSNSSLMDIQPFLPQQPQQQQQRHEDNYPIRRRIRKHQNNPHNQQHHHHLLFGSGRKKSNKNRLFNNDNDDNDSKSESPQPPSISKETLQIWKDVYDCNTYDDAMYLAYEQGKQLKKSCIELVDMLCQYLIQYCNVPPENLSCIDDDDDDDNNNEEREVDDGDVQENPASRNFTKQSNMKKTSTTTPSLQGKGLVLPVSAIGWLTSQIYPTKEEDECYNEQFRKQTDGYFDVNPFYLPSTTKVKLKILKYYLAEKVTHLKIDGSIWPPQPPLSSVVGKNKGPKKQWRKSRDKDSSKIYIDPEITTTFLAFNRYIQNRPHVDMNLFSSLTYLEMDGVVPDFITNLEVISKSIQRIIIHRGCIDNIPIFFRGNVKHEEVSSSSITSTTTTTMTTPTNYPTLRHLTLSYCAIDDYSGLDGRIRRRVRFRNKKHRRKSRRLRPPLTFMKEISSLDFSHNDLVFQETALAGLSVLPNLLDLNLSYNGLQR